MSPPRRPSHAALVALSSGPAAHVASLPPAESSLSLLLLLLLRSSL
jgi:hypothetical protein